jgi:hypothetical protein
MYFENIPPTEHDFNWDEIAGYSGGFAPSVELHDIFRRVVFTEKIKNDTGSFESYVVSEGQKPEEVAQDFYGNPNLWWVVLLCNDIIDTIGEWPKSHGEIVSIYENFLSGNSYFVFENLDIRRGDIIVKRDIAVDGSVDVNNFGEIDNYDQLLHRIDVKKSKGTINENDEVYVFRNNKIAGEDRWNLVNGFGETGCYQQYFGATSCVEFTGPDYEDWGPPCATAGSTFAIVQRKETISGAAHYFDYLGDMVNPYSAYPVENHEGPSGDFYSPKSVCGMTGTILYKYMNKSLSDDINVFTNLRETIRKNDERREIKLLPPKMIPALVREFKVLIQGNVPRGTTKIIE